ncbi:MAG: hypothetical protein ACT4P6_14165 [Gemmatimonadaceae bacterium]
MADELLGHDLDLGFVADEEGRTLAGPSTLGDLRAHRRADRTPRRMDLATVSGRANLVQSLILRLLCEREELSALGIPWYGSRHHALIGEPNTEGNRSLVKLYVLECLRQEPRLERVLKVTVKPGDGLARRDTCVIEISALVIGQPTPLNLVIPFSFAGGVA